MKRGLQTFVALLFSLLLTGAPLLAPASLTLTPKDPPACACCADTNTCGSDCPCLQGDAPSESAPASPATLPPSPIHSYLLLAAPAALAWTLPPAAPSLPSSTVLTPPQAALVPLYERNCSYLI